MKFQLSQTIASLVILSLVVMAAALRLIHLESDPFWIDERGHIEVALSPNIARLFSGVSEHAAAAPLDYLLLRLYQGLTGADTRFELRLPYVFYGVLSVYLIYLLARSIYNPAVGLLSAYALSISFFHIYYSQEVRFYALSVLIGILSTLLFLNAWRKPSWANWLLWGIVSVLGLYTHYFLAFVFIVQFAWLTIIKRRGNKQKSVPLTSMVQPSVVLAISILAFLPWFIWAANAPIKSSSVFGISFGQALFSFISALGPSVAFLVFIPFGVFFKRESWLLLSLTFIPFAGVYVADNLARYFFNARQVIFALPFSITLCSACIFYFASTVSHAAEKQSKAHLKPLLVTAGALLMIVFTWANGIQIWDYFTQ